MSCPSCYPKNHRIACSEVYCVTTWANLLIDARQAPDARAQQEGILSELAELARNDSAFPSRNEVIARLQDLGRRWVVIAPIPKEMGG